METKDTIADVTEITDKEIVTKITDDDIIKIDSSSSSSKSSMQFEEQKTEIVPENIPECAEPTPMSPEYTYSQHAGGDDCESASSYNDVMFRLAYVSPIQSQIESSIRTFPNVMSPTSSDCDKNNFSDSDVKSPLMFTSTQNDDATRENMCRGVDGKNNQCIFSLFFGQRQ
jgi:hypothetical protein